MWAARIEKISLVFIGISDWNVAYLAPRIAHYQAPTKEFIPDNNNASVALQHLMYKDYHVMRVSRTRAAPI